MKTKKDKKKEEREFQIKNVNDDDNAAVKSTTYATNFSVKNITLALYIIIYSNIRIYHECLVIEIYMCIRHFS